MSVTTPQAPQWASIADAAARYKVNPKTIRRWISAGIITGYRGGPRLIRVDLAELDAMLRPIPTAGNNPGRLEARQQPGGSS